MVLIFALIFMTFEIFMCWVGQMIKSRIWNETCFTCM